MPLYRQSQYLGSLNLDIPRGTLATWTIRCGQGVQPVINRLRDIINAGAVQQVDETTLQVLKEKDRRAQSKSQIWVQRGGPPGTPILLFHYAASRSQSVLDDLIYPEFRGAIQSDGYAAYDSFVRLRPASAALVHLGCLAHARRKFVEAAKVQKKKTGAAHMAIALIAKLYAIEAKIKDQAPEDKVRIRQAEAVPILQQMRAALFHYHQL
jgi:transposase